MHTYRIVLYAYPTVPVSPWNVPLPETIPAVRVAMELRTMETHLQVSSYAQAMVLCRFPRADGWYGHNYLTTLLDE